MAKDHLKLGIPKNMQGQVIVGDALPGDDQVALRAAEGLDSAKAAAEKTRAATKAVRDARKAQAAKAATGQPKS